MRPDPRLLLPAAAALLRGTHVPDADYLRRHQVLRLVLGVHLLVLGAYGVVTGIGHVLLELVPLVLLLALSGGIRSLRLRATAVSLGLYGCSAVLVHATGGLTEAHFHFFVVLALVSLYRDALPYLVGIGFVLVEHFVVGTLAPGAVFEHPQDAFAWALVHAGFVALASVAQIASWHSVERRHQDERDGLHAELTRLAAVVDDAGIAILSEDLDGTIRSWNPAATALFGHAAADVLGRSARLLLPPGREHELAENLGCVSAGGSRGYETQRLTRDGVVLDVALLVSPVRDAAGAVVGASLIARDITPQKSAERELARHQTELVVRGEELSRLAYRDPLTGLANRALFLEDLAQAHAEGTRPLTVLMLDLDGFKLVNDSAGHAAGDQLLIQAADRLAAVIGGADTLARLGGDEFAVVLSSEHPLQVAERLVSALAVPFTLGDRLLTVSASIGLAQAAPGDATQELLRNADVALYAAKAAGKNRVLAYDEDMYEAVVRRTDLTEALRTALQEAQLHLHYQPVVALDSGEVAGFEALLRWEHPVRGSISPAEFIPLAEDTGLIVPIGTQVLQQAARTARQLSGRAGRPLSVAVNVSTRQLERPDFPQVVATALEQADLPAAQLVLEVTESALVDSHAAVVAALQAVRALGVAVAIDDFGTGYSSLDRLRTLPVDQLKVDRSFVAELAPAADPASGPGGDTPVLAAIFALAAALGLRTVAEGVETPAQYDALRRMGCTEAQGFLMSRPVPAAEAAELVAFSRPFAALGSPADVVGAELADLMQLVRAAAESGQSSSAGVQHLLEAVCAVTGLEAAFLSTVQPDEDVHEILYAYNAGDVVLRPGERRAWSRSLCHAAATTGTWTSVDVASDYPTADPEGLRRYAGVPLCAPDGTIRATLCAVDRRGGGVDARVHETLTFLSRLIRGESLAAELTRPRTVVVVDDSAVSRRLLEATLLSLGAYEVVDQVADVATAVDVCRRLRPDIVLLDVELPDSDGHAAVAGVHAASPGTEVVVVSASARHRAAAMAAGAVGFLTKDQVITGLDDVLAPLAAAR